METKRVTVHFDKKALNEAGEFEGYGSTFGNVDFGDDMVMAGAFEDDLKTWKSKGQLPMMPWYHDMRSPVGDWIEMSEDSKGLFVKGSLWVSGNKRIEAAVAVHNLFTGTGPKGLSIGFMIPEDGFEWIEQDNKLIRALKRIQLMEISPVPFGMNPEAIVTGAKSLLRDEEGNLRDKRAFEKLLCDSGLSKKEAMTFISKGFNAIQRDAEKDKDIADAEEALSLLLNVIKG